jgi:hypothetical protein
MQVSKPAVQPVRCPHCHSMEAVLIIYGLPSAEISKAASRGEVVLGGCCLGGHNPVWHCKTCQTRWGELFWMQEGER